MKEQKYVKVHLVNHTTISTIAWLYINFNEKWLIKVNNCMTNSHWTLLFWCQQYFLFAYPPFPAQKVVLRDHLVFFLYHLSNLSSKAIAEWLSILEMLCWQAHLTWAGSSWLQVESLMVAVQQYCVVTWGAISLTALVKIKLGWTHPSWLYINKKPA